MPASNSRRCEGRARTLKSWDSRRRNDEDRCRRVPLRPFQERFEELHRRDEITFYRLAQYMGWLGGEGRRGRRPDASEARRRLGFRGSRCADTVDYDTAVRLCRALGLDPHEAGC